MRKVRLAHYALGLHGVAVVRNWLRGDETVATRVRELREFAATLDRNPDNVEFELHEKDVTGGYAAWSATYDEPVNPLVSLEQPIPKTGQPNIKQYLDETEGTLVQSIWDDVLPVNPLIPRTLEEAAHDEVPYYPALAVVALFERVEQLFMVTGHMPIFITRSEFHDIFR